MRGDLAAAAVVVRAVEASGEEDLAAGGQGPGRNAAVARARRHVWGRGKRGGGLRRGLLDTAIHLEE